MIRAKRQGRGDEPQEMAVVAGAGFAREAPRSRLGRSRRRGGWAVERLPLMIHMIGHAIFGLIIGLVARAVMPGRQHMGLILTMILGLVGAWLGGLIGRMLGLYKEGHPAGFFMALVGALIVLFIYSLAVA
jgi:uncharacterized membrane protein YeaQ/YmgE (transglycosylase-associated protein family)